jgi:hypothetical protein
MHGACEGPFFAEPVHCVVFDVLYWGGRCLWFARAKGTGKS